MEIDAIPTCYANVWFRSKLEATWARFFDAIGVSWEYEPTQIPGWIPDFLIGGTLLAEVKPIAVTGFHSAMDPLFRKAIRNFDTALLGDGPGDALGLFVRQMDDGSIYVRHLMVDLEDGPARLYPSVSTKHSDAPLTAIWRGMVESSGSWVEVPFRRAVLTAGKAFADYDGSAA